MPDFLLLMHNDTIVPAQGGDGGWAHYLSALRASGNFEGGSAIGDGVCARKSAPVPAVASHLTGFIRIRAASLEAARTFLQGNPVFEAGGTVEIRELPRSD